MRVGIIDLGSNSIRLDIHEIHGQKSERLLRDRLIVRLGQDVFHTHKLHPAAKQRTIDALRGFKRAMDDYGVTKTVAVGTSALRDARDSAEFLAEVIAEVGIEIKILSGDQEASYIARGILENETMPPGKCVLIDIGGGSTEFIFCEAKQLLTFKSLNLGTVRLQEGFLKVEAPEASSVEALRAHTKELLATNGSNWPKVGTVVGASGTVRTLGRVMQAKDPKFEMISKADLGALVERMIPMSLEEIRAIPGMDAKRADVILAGSLLLEQIVEFVGADGVKPTAFALRDGILRELMARG